MKKILTTMLIGVIIGFTIGNGSAANKKLSNLQDVTGGETIAGIDFNERITGRATAKYYKAEQRLELQASFSRLADAPDGYFYEGWLVREDPFDIISTGKITDAIGTSDKVNNIKINKDLSQYSFYVLTLEPDDGDLSPSELHILEGKVIVRKFESDPRSRVNAISRKSHNAAVEQQNKQLHDKQVADREKVKYKKRSDTIRNALARVDQQKLKKLLLEIKNAKKISKNNKVINLLTQIEVIANQLIQ